MHILSTNCNAGLLARVVFEAEASGGEAKAGGLPHPSLSPFPPLPLSIPPKFSDKPVGGKVRSSEGEVPRLPPYKYHPAVSMTACECEIRSFSAQTEIQLNRCI